MKVRGGMDSSIMVRWRWVMSLLVVGMLLITQLALPRMVEAGTNGQQVRLLCDPGLDEVVVSGYNQYGRWVTWRSLATNPSIVTTWGWYWKGRVRIDYMLTRDGRWAWYHQDADVPSFSFDLINVYDVGCAYNVPRN
jgi:hypothetical protein